MGPKSSQDKPDSTRNGKRRFKRNCIRCVSKVGLLCCFVYTLFILLACVRACVRVCVCVCVCGCLFLSVFLSLFLSAMKKLSCDASNPRTSCIAPTMKSGKKGTGKGNVHKVNNTKSLKQKTSKVANTSRIIVHMDAALLSTTLPKQSGKHRAVCIARHDASHAWEHGRWTSGEEDLRCHSVQNISLWNLLCITRLWR